MISVVIVNRHSYRITWSFVYFPHKQFNLFLKNIIELLFAQHILIDLNVWSSLLSWLCGDIVHSGQTHAFSYASAGNLQFLFILSYLAYMCQAWRPSSSLLWGDGAKHIWFIVRISVIMVKDGKEEADISSFSVPGESSLEKHWMLYVP